MEYKVLNRPKLSRNKYGEVENKDAVGGGNSYFNSTASQNGGASADYSVFVGATNTLDGKKGLVPAPKTNNDEPLISNDKDKFLKGSGAWTDIPISRYTSENTNKDGIDLDGNLTVSDTITTQTLNVLGSAHFWELVIDKVKAAGGNLLITPANFKVDYVGSDVVYTVNASQLPFTLLFYDSVNGSGVEGLQELFTNQSVSQLKAKRLYMKNSDDNNQIVSEFEICDMVRCKTLNLDETNGFTNKDYWTFVLATGTETYNSESCMYIDVLYKYTANNVEYGLGTTINYDSSISPSVDTHLTLHENDFEVGIGIGYGAEKVLIFDSAHSSGNAYLSFYKKDNGDLYEGDISWDGVKWNFGGQWGTGNSIYPNESFQIGAQWDSSVATLECVQDSRFTDPVIKITATGGYYYQWQGETQYISYALENVLSAYGTMYDEDYVDSSSTPTPDLESFKFGYGTFNPAVGDNLVSLGHLWNDERQTAILISSYDPMDTELKAPAIAQYSGINQFTSLSPFRTTSIAANGNDFRGKFMVNYNGNYVDIDERINIFSADLQTGLEKVGIHLDGENSTIKMVGSTEIRQNADGVVDTLTVWDSDDILRVKVSPENIPSKANIETEINPTTTLQFRNNGFYNNYQTTQHHTWKEFIGITWNHNWQYYITSGGYIRITEYANIGNFQAGNKISVGNLNSNLNAIAYFKNESYIGTRSASGRSQSISNVYLRLMRYNGSSWVQVSSTNLSSSATITVGNEDATIKYPSTIIDNYTLQDSGNYRLEFEYTYTPYAEINYSSEQTGFYINFNLSHWTNIVLTQPSASMTRIGSNGLVFNTENAGQYFYSGNDGIQMKWGDALLSLDSTYGLRTSGLLQNITSSSTKNISTSTTLADCRTLSSATTVYLPNTANYGVGRILTILGNDYITIQSYNSSQTILSQIGTSSSYSGYPSAQTNCFSSVQSVALSTTSMKSGNGDDIQDEYFRTHTPLLKLMCTGTQWIKM